MNEDNLLYTIIGVLLALILYFYDPSAALSQTTQQPQKWCYTIGAKKVCVTTDAAGRVAEREECSPSGSSSPAPSSPTRTATGRSVDLGDTNSTPRPGFSTWLKIPAAGQELPRLRRQLRDQQPQRPTGA